MNILIVNHTDETRYPVVGLGMSPKTLAAGGAVDFEIPAATTDVLLKIVPGGYVLKFFSPSTVEEDPE